MQLSFKLPLREVEEQEKLHCVSRTWWAWGTRMLRTPPGQGEGREQPKPAPHASQGILGEKADGKDIPPISKREGLLIHLQTEGLKPAFTENVCTSGLTEAFAV